MRIRRAGRDDELVAVAPVLSRVPDFAALVAPDTDDERSFASIRAAEGTGRPLGNPQFIEDLERILGRRIARRAPGRKPKHSDSDTPSLL
jgi:putative transposase